MKYIALLRGINVGGNRKVEMKRLRDLFEFLGYTEVKTYINSGNITFMSDKKLEALQNEIPKKLEEEFGFAIQTLVKTKQDIQKITQSVPKERTNDTEHKTDIAYLFPEIDYEELIDELPIKQEFVDIKYVKGALIWHLKKKDYNKSHLNKIIGLKVYKLMTVRNINTARYLAENF